MFSTKARMYVRGTWTLRAKINNGTETQYAACTQMRSTYLSKYSNGTNTRKSFFGTEMLYVLRTKA